MANWTRATASGRQLRAIITNEAIRASQNEVLYVRVRGTTAHEAGTQMIWGFCLWVLHGEIVSGRYRKLLSVPEDTTMSADDLTYSAATMTDTNHRWSLVDGIYTRTSGDYNMLDGEYVEYCKLPVSVDPDDD